MMSGFSKQTGMAPLGRTITGGIVALSCGATSLLAGCGSVPGQGSNLRDTGNGGFRIGDTATTANSTCATSTDTMRVVVVNNTDTAITVTGNGYRFANPQAPTLKGNSDVTGQSSPDTTINGGSVGLVAVPTVADTSAAQGVALQVKGLAAYSMQGATSEGAVVFDADPLKPKTVIINPAPLQQQFKINTVTVDPTTKQVTITYSYPDGPSSLFEYIRARISPKYLSNITRTSASSYSDISSFLYNVNLAGYQGVFFSDMSISTSINRISGVPGKYRQFDSIGSKQIDSSDSMKITTYYPDSNWVDSNTQKIRARLTVGYAIPPLNSFVLTSEDFDIPPLTAPPKLVVDNNYTLPTGFFTRSGDNLVIPINGDLSPACALISRIANDLGTAIPQLAKSVPDPKLSNSNPSYKDRNGNTVFVSEDFGVQPDFAWQNVNKWWNDVTGGSGTLKYVNGSLAALTPTNTGLALPIPTWLNLTFAAPASTSGYMKPENISNGRIVWDFTDSTNTYTFRLQSDLRTLPPAPSTTNPVITTSFNGVSSNSGGSTANPQGQITTNNGAATPAGTATIN